MGDNIGMLAEYTEKMAANAFSIHKIQLAADGNEWVRTEATLQSGEKITTARGAHVVLTPMKWH